MAIVAAVGVALYTLGPPKVVPAGAPTSEFSAERAMEDLRVIAEEPRPVGSREHAEALGYLLREIRELYLEPRVQTTTAVVPFPDRGFAHVFLLPQLALLYRTISRWLIPGLAALMCLAFLGVGELTAGFDAERPKPNIVSYEFDADTKEAVWKSPDEDPDVWASRFFPVKTEPASYASFLLPCWLDLDGIKGPAPVVDLPPPTVELLDYATEGGTRTLRCTSLRQGTRRTPRFRYKRRERSWRRT